MPEGCPVLQQRQRWIRSRGAAAAARARLGSRVVLERGVGAREPRPPWEQPGWVWGGQLTTGAAPSSAQGTWGQGRNQGTVLGNRGTGGCWRWLPSHLGVGPPRAALRTSQELNAAANEQKTCSEAKSSLAGLGEGGCGCPARPGLGMARAAPDRGAPQPPRHGRC